MATARQDNVLRIPGRLIAAPTNLNTDFPFGGTELGMASDVIWRPNLRRLEIRGEEYGGEITDIVKTGQAPQLGAFVRGFDPDMIQKVFEGSSESTKSGKPIVDYPTDAAPGTLASATGFVLLYAPFNTEEHPGILLYNAVALLEEVAEMRLSRKAEFGVPVLFYGLRDSSNRVYQKMLMEDMTL
jgi:hypothetical protein